MFGRRDMMAGGIVAGLTALAPSRVEGLAPGGVEGPMSPGEREQQQSERDVREIVQAIDRLRQAVERTQNSCFLGPCGPIGDIRTAQQVFLKAHQKFPDYIDVGVDVWQAVYDWHVRNRQPINTTRLGDGRYGLTFMFTTLVMRPDNTPNYISFGYDSK
jgi:hypothetical protein